MTDPLDRIFTFSYNGNSKHLWKMHEPYPSPYFLEIGYGPLEKVNAIIDQRGNAWNFSYYPPPDQRLSMATNPDGNNLTIEYPSSSQTNVTDENNNQTQYHHGTQGEISQVDRYPVPQGPSITETFVYDTQLNVTGITKPEGGVWENTWDTNGNLLTLDDPITRVDPNLHRAKYTYNSANRPMSAQDASGALTEYEYDSNQNLTKVIDAAGNEVTYGYDSFGNRTSQMVDGKFTTLGYDGNGNLNSLTDPLGNQTQWGFNLLGWQTYRTDALNRTTHYDHDPMGRVKLVTYPDGSKIHFNFDPNGNRILMSDATGTTTWEYNATNQITSENKGPDNIGYTYDSGGRVTSITDQAGETIAYEYDGLNRLTKTHQGTNWEATYKYDNNSNLTEQVNPNGTTVTSGYNDGGWLTSMVNKKSDGAILSSFDYEFDVNGLCSKTIEADGSEVSYHYDSLLRLTNESRTDPNACNMSYEYDPAGNRTRMIKDSTITDYAYDDANRLESKTGTTYGWDANGNQISKTEDGESITYEYDYENQLTAISSPCNVEYVYDGLGRRIKRTTESVSTDFYYNGNQVTTEKQAGTVTAHYIFGASLISRSDTTASEYYLWDGLGSTRQLTNAIETITDDYVYDSFGKPLGASAPAKNPLRFAGGFGYRDDCDDCLLYVGARYYNPETGRFLTSDTLIGVISLPQTLNRYSYVVNNPTNLVDPSGHNPAPYIVVTIIIGGVLYYLFIRVESSLTELDKKLIERNRKQRQYWFEQLPTQTNSSTGIPPITDGNVTLPAHEQRRLLRGYRLGYEPNTK